MTVLVAGIGNIFLGDDGFGVEVVKKLSRRRLPPWIRVRDFGIRGFDLAYTLLDGEHEGVILVDAVKRGHAPGTLMVLVPELEEGPDDVSVETHGMDPRNVLGFVRAMGGAPCAIRVLGCEPLHLGSEDDDVTVGLSPPVQVAVDAAAGLVLEVAEGLLKEAGKHA